MTTLHPVGGPDLLALMTETAAQRAGAHFRAPVRLARCDSCDLRAPPPPVPPPSVPPPAPVAPGGGAPGAGRRAGLALESWLVRDGADEATVAVLATRPGVDGRGRLAGSGRFTFRPA